MAQIETDYLVVGAGACGMSFVDTLLDETDADIVMIDRRHMAGGHWNDAYPFVRLHQPSAFYGVGSTPLGSGRKDTVGHNAGMFDLASGSEVLAYFDKVMKDRFLPSGRVRFFPMSNYEGDARFTSTLRSETFDVDVRKRIVDGSFLNTIIPATHTRKFSVADGIACIAPNEAPRRAPHHSKYVILGAGKTAMDAGVWLLERGADPDAITWVMPRASWVFDRAGVQPSEEFFFDVIGRTAAQMEACAEASSIDDLFDRLEAAKIVHRIHPDIRPSMFHYAILSRGEAEILRRIKNVVRMGRVSRIEPDRIVLAEGEIEADPDALYIDCTASALAPREPVPVFQEKLITLQMIRIPQPSFSASLIAYLEANIETDEERNALSAPIPLSDGQYGWVRNNLANMTNQYLWSQNPLLKNWIPDSRLDGFMAMTRGVSESETEKLAVLKRMRDAAFPAVENMQRLLKAEPPEVMTA